MTYEERHDYAPIPNKYLEYVKVLKHAEDPATHPEALRTFSAIDLDLRLAVAGNPSCPPDLIVELTSDKNISIRKAAAMNPVCPLEISVLVNAEIMLYEEDTVTSNQAQLDYYASATHKGLSDV